MKWNLSLPLQLIGVILFVLLFGTMLPLAFIQWSYTFSFIFKELLGLILPFMVFFFVLAGILSFKKNAPIVLGILLSLVFLSNGIVALFSFGIMQLLSPVVSCERLDLSFIPTAQIESLVSFSLSLPFTAVHALLAALCIGISCSFLPCTGIENIVKRAKGWIERIINRGFIPFLPLYVLGFLLKIRYEGLLSCLMRQYGAAFILIVTLQIVYLIWIYLVALGFDPKKAVIAIKNSIPSYLTAFSTMSSTATIPVSVKSATQNTGNRALADMAMPIMANVHLLGDSIATPILAMTTMLIFQGALPGIMQYAGFVFYFCTTMFAVSGIPGGGILVMIPILVTQLGFTPEMISIITTIYFLLDSFGTAANVMGDGALVIIVNDILNKIKLI